MIERLFYYTAEKIIQNIRQDKIRAEEWYNILKDKLSNEEEKDLGILNYIKECSNRLINKSELLQYININRLVINESIIPQNEIDPIRLKYTSKKLTNYREIVISVPNIAPYYVDEIHFSDVAAGQEICWCRCADLWEGNNKILIIDEMQSNRHQSAHRYGYKSDFTKTYWDENWISRFLIEDDDLSVAERTDKLRRYIEQFAKNKIAVKNAIPDAPFRKWWQFLVKRILHHAIENGYSELRITGGNLQLRRYSLDESSGLGELYDKIIMKYFAKYLKKWHIQPAYNNDWWCVNITEEIKRDILNNKQPLFSVRDNTKNISSGSEVTYHTAARLCRRFKFDIVASADVCVSPSLLGWYDKTYDKVYIVYDNHKNIDELFTTIVHESLAHRGLKATLGNRYEYFLRQVYLKVMNPEQKNEYMDKYKNFYTAAEEFCADIFETMPQENNIVQAICTQIKLCLIKIGFNCSLSLNDIYHLAAHSIKKHKLPFSKQNKKSCKYII